MTRRQEEFNPDGPFVFRSPTKSAVSPSANVTPSALTHFPSHGPTLANDIFPGAAQASPHSSRDDEIKDSVMVDTYEPYVRPCPNETMSSNWTCCGIENDHDEPECRKCGNRRCHVKAEGWGDCFASISLEGWKCTVCYTANPNSLEVCASCETPHT